MLITRKERQTHWYLPDGTPFYDVPYVDPERVGELRPATIRDAMKAGAFRSVTNVLGVVAKEGLANWRIEQAIISALTLPRRAGENEHDFAYRALVDSEAPTLDAAKDGTLIHDIISQWLMNQLLPPDPGMVELIEPFIQWAHTNIKRVIYSEKVVVNPRQHYAGKLDVFAEMRAGGYAIIDVKTQELEPDEEGKLVPDFYPEWPMQLAAYEQCDALQFWTPANHKLISVVLGRNTPFCAPKEWAADSAHFEAFLAACTLWTYLRKGKTPGKK